MTISDAFPVPHLPELMLIARNFRSRIMRLDRAAVRQATNLSFEGEARLIELLSATRGVDPNRLQLATYVPTLPDTEKPIEVQATQLNCGMFAAYLSGGNKIIGYRHEIGLPFIQADVICIPGLHLVIYSNQRTIEKGEAFFVHQGIFRVQFARGYHRWHTIEVEIHVEAHTSAGSMEGGQRVVLTAEEPQAEWTKTHKSFSLALALEFNQIIPSTKLAFEHVEGIIQQLGAIGAQLGPLLPGWHTGIMRLKEALNVRAGTLGAL